MSMCLQFRSLGITPKVTVEEVLYAVYVCTTGAFIVYKQLYASNIVRFYGYKVISSFNKEW